MRSSPMMQPEESPISRQTFAEPLITILATDPAAASFPQAAELWLANQRLTAPTQVVVDQSLAQITYTMDDDQGAPVFENPAQGKSWLPVDQFSTPLFLPCEGRTTPYAYLAHFISDPTLAPGIYRPHAPNTLTNIAVSLSTRLRDLEPIQASLSFASYLSPLHLQLAGQPNVNLSQIDLASSQTTAHVQLTATDTLLPVTIRWQARRWMADPLVVSLKLLDQDFVIVGERIATLGDRYPNVLWVPTEVVEETYPIEVRPAAPPGLYRLELSLVHQNENLPSGFEYLPVINGETNLGVNLYPATVRLLDPAHDIPPTYVLSAQLGEAIQLIGYSLDQSPILQRHSGQISSLQSPIFLALYWQSKAKISTDYTVFTQLVGPDGQVWAQWDNPPQAGRYPTTAWEENDAVVDRYTLRLRQGAPSGQYRLLVGMYHPSTGQRLPVTVDERPQPDQAVELTKFSLAP